MTSKTQSVHDNQAIIKSYVENFHQENERARRELGREFYNESIDLVKNNKNTSFKDNRLTNLDSITVTRNPSSDNGLANKNYVDESLDRENILRFSQTLENYIEVSIVNEVYKLIKADKIQITDTINSKNPNTGGHLLQQWQVKMQ